MGKELEVKNEFSGNIIRPLLDEKGNRINNVEIIRKTYKIMKALKESDNIDDKIKFAKLIHNDNNIYEYFKQIAEIEDYDVANAMLKKTIIPVGI